MWYKLHILLVFMATTTFAQQAGVERFDVFYQRFHKDSLFQLSRVKFPLPGVNTEVDHVWKQKYGADPVNYHWTKQDWPMHRLLTDTVTYKIRRRKEKGMLVEDIYIPDSDFLFTRKFRLLDGKWFLVYMLE